MFRLAALTILALVMGGAQVRAQTATAGPDTLRAIAARSQCAAYEWQHRRGRAPRSYIEGVALVFARAVCQPQRSDVDVVSSPADLSPHGDDGLAIYRAKFAALNMPNDRRGVDTLRHSYVLLIGLGMMESSGRYCEGRDVSQCFDDPESAEAGPFQTSYGARKFSPALTELTEAYSAGRRNCLLEVFRGSISCRIVKSQNPKCPTATSDVVGSGPGADWQRLTKTCPAFATEYGAVVLRKHGGEKGEFNPIRKRQAEVIPACDAMLRDVQAQVEQHPDICAKL